MSSAHRRLLPTVPRSFKIGGLLASTTKESESMLVSNLEVSVLAVEPLQCLLKWCNDAVKDSLLKVLIIQTRCL
jgi:hypothetical protein